MTQISRAEMAHRITAVLAEDVSLARRFQAVRDFSRTVRVSEYHVTNACNIRCKGCWFFAHDFDKASRENKELEKLRQFITKERQRGVNSALLIGGEPSLFPERVAEYVAAMETVSISTNGLKALPREGFEHVNVFVSLFGGGKLDDELRAIRPNGKPFSGLFASALGNYRHDERTTFVYALTETGIDYIDDTVAKIADNGNQVTFNFYSQYHADDPLHLEDSQRLLDEALRVRDRYPQVVLSTPYYIRTMISGETPWGVFGYENCPSISIAHPAHKDRLTNGNRTLPLFNTYAPDLETVNFCCTSGHCEDCRDSQAVFSWLLVSLPHFTDSLSSLRTWVELSESYWSQFVWSPFHRSKRATLAQTGAVISHGVSLGR